MYKKIFITAMSAFLLTACSKQAAETSGLNYENLDTTVRPGDDFFQYATGQWLSHNPQPAAYPRWGSFTKLGDDNVNQIAGLVQGIAAQTEYKSHAEQLIGDLYNLSMDSVRRDNEGIEPVRPYLQTIYDFKTREELISYMAQEHDDILFGIGIGADAKNASQNIVGIGQGGLSLGNRDYYLNDDEATVKVREAFKKHMVNLYVLFGFTEAEAKAKMELVMKYETELAKVSYSRLQMRDPEANYHKMSLQELSKATRGFDWSSYFLTYGYDQTSEVDLGQPEPVAKACEMLLKAPLADLKTIYEWHTINGASGFLGDAFINENFSFRQVLTGAKEMQPRWKRSVNFVDGVLGTAVGQMYVEKYFPQQNKDRMVQLVKNLQEALGKRIQAQEWMSDTTKVVALEKLSTFYPKIGFPDQWDDLSALTIDPAKSLLDNMQEAGRFFWALDKEKHYNKPVDKDEWLMTPQTVNAYYNPTTNEICFPAGILQPPFFDMAADDAINYGAIGVVIGHEMTHGFDDQGRQFDKDGNLRQWWTDADVEAFKVPAEALATYFDSLYVLPGLHANGHMCLGENLADHGGLMVAYEAFQMAQQQNGALRDEVINGVTYTPAQRFFLAYANVWAGVNTEEGIRNLTTNDVHSINYLRVNGTLPHINEWYEAFGVQEGDSLYIAPADRVNIW